MCFAQKSSHKNGITLPEILIAISISAIIFIAGYAMLSSSIRQFTDGINQLESQRNGRKIISYFRMRLFAAVSGIKTVNIGEKAPTGLSSGIEFDTITRNEGKPKAGGEFYETATETYYLSKNQVMMKAKNSGQPKKIFDSVRSIYFKVFTVERSGRKVPLVLIQVTTFCGNQSATYESMVLPVFISSLKFSDGLVMPLFNSYAIDSVN